MRRILIIEDDPALGETLKAALEVENYEAVLAEKGDEGFLLASRDEFDLILLDLVLPNLTGFEVCQRLRENGVMTPLIFMTGEKKEEIDKVLGLELGGDDYITKPFGTRELLARIKAVLRRSQQPLPELEEGWRFLNSWEHGPLQVISHLWESLGIRRAIEAALQLRLRGYSKDGRADAPVISWPCRPGGARK